MNYIKPFKFWVQSVLPQVYDDSLSYYELLNKVVEYLNKVIDNVNELGESYAQLQRWIVDYFESQNFSQIIEDTLDKMVESGEFDEYIQRVIMSSNSITDNGLSVLVNIPSDEIFEYYKDNLMGMHSGDIYALYDQLPDLTKHIYGNDGFGNDLVYYTYDAPVMKNAGTFFTTMGNVMDGLPHLLLLSGVHGNEKGAVINIYLFVKELLTHKEKYSSLIQNVGMTIIPIITPYAFDRNRVTNGNGVNVNRNFPNNFEASSTNGAVALDQPEAAFVATIINNLRDTWKSGLFVVDNHQFITSEASNALFWYNCASDIAPYQSVRFNLMKSVGYLRNKILSKYPNLVPTENVDNFNLFYQIAYEPTIESYFAYKGCSGFLCESMSQINGGATYSVDSLWIDFVIRSTSIWNTVAKFETKAKKIIHSLIEINASSSMHLNDVIAKVPYRSKLVCLVEDESTLDSDLPYTLGNCVLEIDKVSVEDAIIKVYKAGSSGDATFTFTNHATNNVVDDEWLCNTPLDVYKLFPGQLSIDGIVKASRLYPAQITYATNGGALGVPNDGLLLIIKPFKKTSYQHIWLININEGCTYINVAHITPTSETVTWRRLSTSSMS